MDNPYKGFNERNIMILLIFSLIGLISSVLFIAHLVFWLLFEI
jgi:hypothetical protein